MSHPSLLSYIKATESMILPEQVARINQASNFLRKLPLKIQNYLARKGSEKNPYMGFVVEPYSFFLAYEILDTGAAQRLLPPGYRLAPLSLFEGEKPRFAAILGAFNIHTSVFWGSRLETYLIAENEKTGLLSWIIAGYETNTNSYDPARGFIGPTTERAVITTSYRGQLLVDVSSAGSKGRLALVADLKGAPEKRLDPRLWIEGNLSVDYGGGLESGDTQPFGLIFDPGEMEKALRPPLESLRIEENGLALPFLAPAPFDAACFPFAQHFVTTSMPADLGIRDAAGLEAAVARIGGGGGREKAAIDSLNAAIIA